MLEVSEARSRILEAMKPTGSELVSLPEAAGRVLSQSVRANVTNPPTDVSSMDGYAVRAEDACAGRLLAVIGEAPAGHPSDLSVDPGTSIRIFTGSVMPAGAETVVIQENTERRGANIFLTENVQAGAFIRRAGQDFAAGDILVAAGKRLGSRDIGLAAAGNVPWVSVYRRPRVAILSTGDELVMPGEALPSGGILGSAGLMLQALLRSAGADVVLLPVARDDEAEIRRLVSGLDAVDLLVTIGGASVGDYDLVQSALKAAGLRTEFWKIAMRPGKPLMFGHLGRVPMVGLPGNPVAAYVCALRFLLPAIRVLSGCADVFDEPVMALVTETLPANDRREDHLRATLGRSESGQLTVTPYGRQDSAMMATLAGADALILRAPYAAELEAGEFCPVFVLPEGKSR